MRALSITAVGLFAGCTVGVSEPPDPPPPVESWGVPISGGTILVTRDGARAVVADPDTDRVVVIDIASEAVLATLDLAAGSEPGRVIEDGTGRIHVALRGSGELLTITGADHQLRAVCGEPRGLAWQEASDLVHVACATGELVSLPAGGGDPVRAVYLERDLRDVIVRPTGALAVTTFRTADLIDLDANGAVVRRLRSPIVHRIELGSGLDAVGDIHDAVASVAWRTIALPDGRILMSHQRRVGLTLSPSPGGYRNSCGGPVESALTVFNPDGTVVAVTPSIEGALPVDVAVQPGTGAIAIATAGNRLVWTLPNADLATPDDEQCIFSSRATSTAQLDTPTSIAYAPNGTLYVFLPESNTIAEQKTGAFRLIELGGTRGYDAGRALFHRDTSSGLACASCHPEARDDGGVWAFEGLGVRRTQNLAGSILSRAPYHWGADMSSLPVLLEDVFAQRMGGEFVPDDAGQALGPWLDRVQAPLGVVRDADAVTRGEALFMAPEQGCASCHVGPLFTNNMVANVGTNGIVKVPSLLGVGGRAPYLHDGCAATLLDRFGPCGGGDNHGHTSQLTPAQVADLAAYLEAL